MILLFSKRGSPAPKFRFLVYCDNEICMLRQNEWYASFPDWTCIYQVSIKRKYPALVYHVVRTNEEEEDFRKEMFI